MDLKKRCAIMKTKIVVVALITITAGVFTFTGTKNSPPSDFRDAVADNKDFNTSIPVFEKDSGNIPVPVAATSVIDIDGLSIDLLVNATGVTAGLETLNKYNDFYLKNGLSMTKAAQRVYDDVRLLDKITSQMLPMREQLAGNPKVHKRIAQSYSMLAKVTALKIVSSDPMDLMLVQGIESRLDALKINLQIIAGEFKR